MDHPVAVGTQHRKVSRHIIRDRNPLLEAGNRLEVMRLNKTLADFAITLFEI
jgi:hypothetical protein